MKTNIISFKAVSLLLCLTILNTSSIAKEKSAGTKAIEAANKSIININTKELQEILAKNPKRN